MDLFENRIVEKSGRTVEEAVELALIALEANRDQVEIEVLEESSKGFLGIFGGKEATVRVTYLKGVEEIATEFLTTVLDEMGIDASLNTALNDHELSVEMAGEHMALLIGRRGQTLDSLQYLLSLVVNKNSDDYYRVILDTEGYRAKRKDTLERLADRLARKAKKTRKDIILEPMNPYERRIIHSSLQNNPYVSTRSEGEEPYRKVIIFLNRRK